MLGRGRGPETRETSSAPSLKVGGQRATISKRDAAASRREIALKRANMRVKSSKLKSLALQQQQAQSSEEKKHIQDIDAIAAEQSSPMEPTAEDKPVSNENREEPEKSRFGVQLGVPAGENPPKETPPSPLRGTGPSHQDETDSPSTIARFIARFRSEPPKSPTERKDSALKNQFWWKQQDSRGPTRSTSSEHNASPNDVPSTPSPRQGSFDSLRLYEHDKPLEAPTLHSELDDIQELNRLADQIIAKHRSAAFSDRPSRGDDLDEARSKRPNNMYIFDSVGAYEDEEGTDEFDFDVVEDSDHDDMEMTSARLLSKSRQLLANHAEDRNLSEVSSSRRDSLEFSDDSDLEGLKLLTDSRSHSSKSAKSVRTSSQDSDATAPGHVHVHVHMDGGIPPPPYSTSSLPAAQRPPRAPSTTLLTPLDVISANKVAALVHKGQGGVPKSPPSLENTSPSLIKFADKEGQTSPNVLDQHMKDQQQTPPLRFARSEPNGDHFQEGINEFGSTFTVPLLDTDTNVVVSNDASSVASKQSEDGSTCSGPPRPHPEKVGVTQPVVNVSRPSTSTRERDETGVSSPHLAPGTTQTQEENDTQLIDDTSSEAKDVALAPLPIESQSPLLEKGSDTALILEQTSSESSGSTEELALRDAVAHGQPTLVLKDSATSPLRGKVTDSSSETEANSLGDSSVQTDFATLGEMPTQTESASAQTDVATQETTSAQTDFAGQESSSMQTVNAGQEHASAQTGQTVQGNSAVQTSTAVGQELSTQTCELVQTNVPAPLNSIEPQEKESSGGNSLDASQAASATAGSETQLPEPTTSSCCKSVEMDLVSLALQQDDPVCQLLGKRIQELRSQLLSVEYRLTSIDDQD